MKIYCITNSVNGKQYVGQTVQEISNRWRQHVQCGGRCRALESAIKKYGSEAFSIAELCAASSQDELDQLEQLWIEKLVTIAPRGYNLSGGGGGIGKMHDDTKAILRAHARTPDHIDRFNAMRSRPDIIARQTEGKRERWRDPGNKARYGAAISAALNEPSVKKKRSASLRDAWAKPENKEALLRHLEKVRQSPEARAKKAASMSKAWNEPGAREARAAAIRAAKATPEFKAKYAATNARPEVKARRSAANKARMFTPEQRARISARMTGKKRGPYRKRRDVA